MFVRDFPSKRFICEDLTVFDLLGKLTQSEALSCNSEVSTFVVSAPLMQ